MYVWVSAALRAPSAAIRISASRSRAPSTKRARSGRQTAPPDAAKKLIDKLLASGQLKPSFLVRVLHRGQMELFEQGFAAL
jgi:hypothetical protein